MLCWQIMIAIGTTISAPATTVYIGTYTTPGGSKGIYRSILDTKTGALTAPELAVEAPSPSYLAIHPNGKTLYAVLEETSGEAASFTVTPTGLKPLNRASFHGSGPCHLAIDPTGKRMLVAAYGGGTVANLPVMRDGRLANSVAVLKNSGSGPRQDRQEGPHMHSVAFVSASEAYACDLGTDEVLHLKVGEGTLETAQPRSIKLPDGSGPRHLAIHPNKKWVYVNDELSCTLTFLTRSDDGSLHLRDSIATLPEGHPTPQETTSEIELHPNQKWLYVSNRGHDSISVFRLSDEGVPSLVEIATAGVKEPRGFAIDPSGKWLIVAGQNSNDLASLKIDQTTGQLGEPYAKVAISKPVCVIFGR